jgi:DNA/RNA-binding domain of Phe-tRNA-synthetase-like protein
MTMLLSTERWRAAYPGAGAGLLMMRNVTNPEAHPALDQRRAEIEAELHARYGSHSKAEIRASGNFPAYDAFYKTFGQTYHVLMQVESVALKGKPIPRRAALVEAAFMPELRNGILTAAHDLDELDPPMTIDLTDPDETFELYNGKTQACKADDMTIRDRRGITSTIICGPAAYARVTPATTAALFYCYAPAGIPDDAVRAHLVEIEHNVRLFAPDAETIALETVTTA